MTLKTPVLVKIDADGSFKLSAKQTRQAGFRKGEQLLMLPLDSGQYMLTKVTVTPSLSPDELSKLMQTTFQQAGYETEEKIIELIQETKKELAHEW